jgi:hypothetical protein
MPFIARESRAHELNAAHGQAVEASGGLASFLLRTDVRGLWGSS